MEVKPTYFPSVPRIFEKIYTLATSSARRTRSSSQQAVELGVKVRQMQERGEEVPAELQAGTSTRPSESSTRTSATCSAGASASA